MIIRDEQIEAFEQAALKNFEERMVAHLNQFFPAETRTLGDLQTRSLIREGKVNAEKYSILAERDLFKFIDVMFTLGRQFDTDPRSAWATQILTDPKRADPSERVDCLVRATLERTDRGGPLG